MDVRSISCVLLALALQGLAACQLISPTTSGTFSTKSGWASAPAFAAGAPSSKRIHVRAEDPAKSALGAQLAQSFASAVAARGYVGVDSAAEADLECVLVVRYFGKTVPPDGHVELLAQAGDTIQGGDEKWLAADGSGYDTENRKPRAVRFRSGVRSRVGEVFRGHEDDEWTLLVDVAIGARAQGSGKDVQRHEGRAWASTTAEVVDRASAATALTAELRSRFAESLP
ncbi:MAG TPA: hypothetical protein VM509_04830 [Planctomycetota bacterium]|nr:hypothetical protein [Planctomycetota bacterium]